MATIIGRRQPGMIRIRLNVSDLDHVIMMLRWIGNGERMGTYAYVAGEDDADGTFDFYFSDANTALDFRMRWC